MTRLAQILRDTYRDSVSLMAVSTRLAELPGVQRATTIMGTPANLEILAATRLGAPELEDARPNDLCIVVEAADDAAAQAALATARDLLAGAGHPAASAATAEAAPRSLESALRALPDANLAMISVPGQYAAAEARRALNRGLHVFLFSDNVPLEDEIALKRQAQEQGLLVMGPDCGTALIAGVPLGFANAVRRGHVGIVGSSGTGIQEVASLVDRAGGGVSHAIGTGSRDLLEEVGAITTLAAIDALEQDEDTAVIALVSKPSSPSVRELVAERLARLSIPSVAYFIGTARTALDARPAQVDNLEALAVMSLFLAGVQSEPLADETGEPLDALLANLAPSQRRVVGLFCGGTLAAEAAGLLDRSLEGEREPPAPGELLRKAGHRVVDLGDDVFTRGRPHPIIDPRLRNELLVKEASSGAVALFVLDVILGYGCHPDPAAALRPALEAARAVAGARGERLRVLASVTGTDADPQGYHRQVQALQALGVTVAATSTRAAAVAARATWRLSRPS